MPSPNHQQEDTLSHAEDPEWSRCCPICLENIPLVTTGSCQHAFCLECLEQFFSLQSTTRANNSAAASTTTTAPAEANPADNGTVSSSPFASLLDTQLLLDHNLDGIPTLGRCPLCRSPISLLDVRDRTTGVTLFAGKEQNRLEESPLAGKVFTTHHGVGMNSFHFPPFLDSDNRHGQITKPYFLWQEDDALYTNSSSNDLLREGKEQQDTFAPPTSSGSSPQPHKYCFEDGCFYFAPTRTFHGSLHLPGAHTGTWQRHDVILAFVPNHAWIEGGMMLCHHYDDHDNKSDEEHQQQFPLDGRWEVQWFAKLPPTDQDDHKEQMQEEPAATDHIIVTANHIHAPMSKEYSLMFGTDGIVRFHWAGMGVTQTLMKDSSLSTESSSDSTSGQNSRSRPKMIRRIPTVGEKLRWRTTDPNQPFIVWTRQSIATTLPQPTSIQYLGRSGGDTRHAPLRNTRSHNVTWYRLWRSESSRRSNIGLATSPVVENATLDSRHRARYHPESLWGNTFCQGLRVGLASYHFVEEVELSERHGNNSNANSGSTDETPTRRAYISYEHAACRQWPPLDDGYTVPRRVYFHNISVEERELDTDDQGNHENSRRKQTIFRGTIEWLQDFGTTWQNHARWEYEMQFDSDFTCVVGGAVHSLTADQVLAQSTSERQELSAYGDHLIYVNADIIECTRRWMASIEHSVDGAIHDRDDSEIPNHNNAADVMYQRYTEVSRRLRQRLHREGASVRTVAMLNTVFTMSQQPGAPDPIDYNL